MTNVAQHRWTGIDIPSSDVITQCMHCGFCLPVCPTYALTTSEKASPRGRIRLIKAAAEGELAITPGFVEAMHFCLDCRACETACPAGVRYGELVEAARARIDQAGNGSWMSRAIKRIVLRGIFPSPGRLRMLGRLMAFYRRSGAAALVERSGILRLSRRWSELHAMMPIIPPSRGMGLPNVIPARGERRARVGILTGCVMDILYNDINRDTAAVLARNGCEVHIVRKQVCCGSLHGHTGDRASARMLARKNIDAFAAEGLDAVIVNSAGCGSFMKHYDHLLAEDPAYAEKAARFSRTVRDISEYLVKIGFAKPTRSLPARVTYHEACHLVHGQKISRQPRAILDAIPGLEQIEMEEATWCCGSAGIYNVTRTADSLKLLDRKMAHIRATGATVVATANPGCLLQLAAGARREGLPLEIVHPVSLLRRAYE